jgi:hypothetical protein
LSSSKNEAFVNKNPVTQLNVPQPQSLPTNGPLNSTINPNTNKNTTNPDLPSQMANPMNQIPAQFMPPNFGPQMSPFYWDWWNYAPQMGAAPPMGPNMSAYDMGFRDEYNKRYFNLFFILLLFLIFEFEREN